MELWISIFSFTFDIFLHWARARKGLQNYSWLFIMGAFCVTTQNQDKWKIFIVNTRNMQHLIDHLFHFQQEPHMPKRLDKQYCPLQISLCANILRANIRHTVCKYQPAQAWQMVSQTSQGKRRTPNIILLDWLLHQPSFSPDQVAQAFPQLGAK